MRQIRIIRWVSKPYMIILLYVLFQRRIIFPFFHVIPIYIFEKCMLFYLWNGQSLLGIFLQKTNKKISKLLGYFSNVSVQYLFDIFVLKITLKCNLTMLRRCEWVLVENKLKDKDSQ